MRNEQDLKVRRERAAEMLREFDGSGLPRKAFAKNHGVSVSTLDYWRAKERQKRLKAASGASMVFSEMKLEAPDLQKQGGWAMEIVSPKGLTVRSREVLPAQLLIRLFRSRGC